MNYRPFSPTDAPAMQSLRLEGLKTDAYAFGSSYQEEVTKPSEHWVARCTPNENSVCFGAFTEEGEAVAMLALVRETSLNARHHANIYSVITRQSHRGQGHSKRLLTMAIEQAKAWDGMEWLQLGVAVDNIPALTLYQKAGFKTWGTMKSALRVDGRDIDEHLMALKLSDLEG